MPISISARLAGGPLRVEANDGTHTVVTDEPEEKGGGDAAIDPHSLLPLALATCTTTTIKMYALRKGWDVGDARVEVDYDPDGPRFDVRVHLPAHLDGEQRERVMRIAGKCPVHRTLVRASTVELAEAVS